MSNGIWWSFGVSWNFGNDFPRNAIIFGVDNNISSLYTDIQKNNFLESVQGQLMILMITGAAEKNLVVTLLKQIKSFL